MPGVDRKSRKNRRCVTVTGVSLRIDRGTAEEYAVTPRTFILRDFSPETSSQETFFRIEPYDQRSILFDYWSVVDATFAQFPDLRDIRVFAEVTVAGHEHQFDSKKMGYWRIQRDHISAMGSGRIRRPRNAFLMSMLRNHTGDLRRMNNLDRLAVKIEETLSFPASAEDWKTAIDHALASSEGRLARIQWKEDTDNAGFFASGIVGYELEQHNEKYGDRFRPFSSDDPGKEAEDLDGLWNV